MNFNIEDLNLIKMVEKREILIDCSLNYLFDINEIIINLKL